MTDWVPLKRIARLMYGDALPAELRNDGEVPVIGSGEIAGTHDVPNTMQPAIVIGRKGSYGSVYWAQRGAFVIDTAYFIDERRCRTDLRWLFYVLQSVDLRGTSQDVGVPGLSREAAHAVLIPNPPPLDEQRAIVDCLDQEVDRIDTLRESIRKQMFALIERRQALISGAVMGQIDVTTARGVDV